MHVSDKVRVLDYLSETRARLSTVASFLGIDEDYAKALVSKINEDGIYEIKSVKGGGLELSGGIKKEKDAYPQVAKCAEAWMVNHVYGPRGVTARIVRPTHERRLNGKWSTPDFAGLCVHNFPHTKTKRVEIVTFEVKNVVPEQFNVSSVYETLAHTRASNYSILLFCDNPICSALDPDAYAEIKMECLRLGIGMVVSRYPCDVGSWDYVVPARSFDPDPRRVEAFIEDAFSIGDKRWLSDNL